MCAEITPASAVKSKVQEKDAFTVFTSLHKKYIQLLWSVELRGGLIERRIADTYILRAVFSILVNR